MASFFLDTSALIKRYVAEKGTNWMIKSVFVTGNYLVIARIAHAEIASAFARKVRGQTLTPPDENSLLRLFRYHLKHRFAIVEIDAEICEQAAKLARNHALRGYDSVQLSCVLRAENLLQKVGDGGLTFLTADKDLLKAGQTEGLSTDNPENH